MTDEGCRILLGQLAEKPWPERVQFFLENLRSLRSAMDQFIDACLLSGPDRKSLVQARSRGSGGISREQFVEQYRDAFSEESLCRLLATRFMRNANPRNTPEDELPVDAFQIESERTKINGKSLTRESEFAEFDQWLNEKRSKSHLSRLSELAFVRACEEGCHPERKHSRRDAMKWFYNEFGPQVERELRTRYPYIRDQSEIEDAVAQALFEFYRTYIADNDHSALLIKRKRRGEWGPRCRSRWAGRMFLVNFLTVIAIRRLPRLLFVLTSVGLDSLRGSRLSDATMARLSSIVGFTYKTRVEMNAAALGTEVLTTDQISSIQNALSRTLTENPPPQQKTTQGASREGRTTSAASGDQNEVDQLIRSVVANEIPPRGIFAEAAPSGGRQCSMNLVLTEIGRRLRECINKSASSDANPSCNESVCEGCIREGASSSILTDVERLRLIDYLYFERGGTSVGKAAAANFSRKDGLLKLRHRRCFHHLLGQDLQITAAEVLRLHIDNKTLPPSGLFALLFSEDQVRKLCAQGSMPDNLAFEYHYLGLPMRRLKSNARIKYYRALSESLAKDGSGLNVAGLIEKDLAIHWQQAANAADELLRSFGNQLREGA